MSTFIVKKLIKPYGPVHIFNGIFGIGIIEYPLGTQRPVLSFIYSSITILIYCTLSGVSVPYVLKISEYFIDKDVIKFLIPANIFLVTSFVILGWFRNKGLNDCLKKLAEADAILQDIGVPKNYQWIRKKYIIEIVYSSTIIVVAMVVKGVLLSKNLSAQASFLAAIVTNYPLIVIYVADSAYTGILREVFFYRTINTVSQYVSLLKNVFSFIINSYANYKFQKLNEKLRSLSTGTIDFPQHKKVLDSRCYVRKVFNGKESVMLKHARQAHMKISIACDLVNANFGLQILLSIVIGFTNILGNLHNTYRLILEFKVKSPQKVYKSVGVSCFYVFYYIIKIGIFSNACTNCQLTSVRTGDCINELYDEPFLSSEAQNEIRSFNTQLMQMPVHFTALGFIDLDMTLIRVMASSIITFLIIIIQLGKGPSATNIVSNIIPSMMHISTNVTI